MLWHTAGIGKCYLFLQRCKMQSNEAWSSHTMCERNFSLGFYVEKLSLDRGKANDFELFCTPTFKGNQDTKEKEAALQHCTVTEFSGLQTRQKLSWERLLNNFLEKIRDWKIGHVHSQCSPEWCFLSEESKTGVALGSGIYSRFGINTFKHIKKRRKYIF